MNSSCSSFFFPFNFKHYDITTHRNGANTSIALLSKRFCKKKKKAFVVKSTRSKYPMNWSKRWIRSIRLFVSLTSAKWERTPFCYYMIDRVIWIWMLDRSTCWTVLLIFDIAFLNEKFLTNLSDCWKDETSKNVKIIGKFARKKWSITHKFLFNLVN